MSTTGFGNGIGTSTLTDDLAFRAWTIALVARGSYHIGLTTTSHSNWWTPRITGSCSVRKFDISDLSANMKTPTTSQRPRALATIQVGERSASASAISRTAMPVDLMKQFACHW